VTPLAIDRDPEELGVEFLDLGENLVVESHLVAADRTPVGGIEGEDDRPPAKVGEGDGLVRGRVEGEVGSRYTGLKC
jgi:hypothetical protein